MRDLKNKLVLLLCFFALFSCSTEDVVLNDTDTEQATLYPLSDAAFAEYLIYNSKLGNHANALPFGICIARNDSFFLDVQKAATAKMVYLVKDATRIANLEAAGVATAAVKLQNIDGIQFFENCSNLRLTSNSIVGELNLSALVKLDTLEMNANMVHRLMLPASITRLRYSASSAASDAQRLSAIDLSNNSELAHLFLTNHRIVAEGLQLPTSYTRLREIDLSGNSGAPFEIPEALFNQLTTKNGVTPVTIGGDEEDEDELYLLSDVAFAEYLIYNSNLGNHANALPVGVCIARNDSFFLDIQKAATAKMVYLVKDATRIANLEAAGVATAAVKLQNIDGIQFFENCSNLRLTSNSIVGELDLSALVRLDTLEMNANMVSRLTLPASVTRLRYSASSAASDTQRLSAIDLSSNSQLVHLFLTNHLIVAEGLQLPTAYTQLREIDLSGNVAAPFEIPEALFNQLTTKNGVTPIVIGGGDEEEEVIGYEVPDKAFADYLLYLTEKVTDLNLRLPEGTAFEENGIIYINTEIAATYKGLMNISKANAVITTLTNAGVASASVKIANADGLQHFTALKQLVATSNAFTVALPLQRLTQLDSLVVRTAGVSSIDLSGNVALRYLDIQGSTSASLGRLSAADLSNNTKLIAVNLSANEIEPTNFATPSTYAFLKTLNMGTNKVNNVTVTYTVPATLFDQLGSASADKAGLVKGD